MVLVLATLPSGCSPNSGTTAPVQAVGAEQSPPTPGEIELSGAKVTLVDPQTVQFEVNYRFTKGKPDKYYSWDISFPGTPNHAVGMMSSWELKAEGVLKDRVMLKKPPVKYFEIHMSEAASPQDGYKIISNVVSGQVE